MRFLEQWSWCDLDAFHTEARKRATSDLSYIEIAKHFEWDEHGFRDR